MMRRTGVIVIVLLGGLAGLGAATGTASQSDAARPPQGRPTCTLQAGVLEIDPGYWVLTIRRQGEAIVPTYARGRVPCSGGPVSVHTVDRMRLLDADIELDLRRGPLAPGITDEGDGSSEIEIEIDYGFGGALDLTLPNDADRLMLGELDDGRRGINLNADETNLDVDVAIAHGDGLFGEAELAIEANDGADIIDASGGPGFARPYDFDFEVGGGAGADTVRGGSETDSIWAGGGRDRIAAGASNDIVFIKGGGRDFAGCGRGKDDVVEADRDDKTRSCKTIDEIDLGDFLDG